MRSSTEAAIAAIGRGELTTSLTTSGARTRAT